MKIIKKKKNSRYLKVCSGSFKDIWQKINDKPLIPFVTQKEIIIDTYFDEKPQFQEYLTQKGKTTNFPIDISNYNQTPASQLNPSKLFDGSHGIISFISYMSSLLLNVGELEFHFSGAMFRKSYEDEMKHKRIIDNIDILNIMNAEDPRTYFQIGPYRDAFFGVTFKNIKITPIFYFIRAGQLVNRLGPFLTSFTFEAYDEETEKWVVLDQRVNINDLNPSGGFCLFAVKTTTKSYSSFRIHQTDVGGNECWGFTIAAFDIHGIPESINEKVSNDNKMIMISEKQELVNDNDEYFFNMSFNPCIDLGKSILLC